MNKLTKAQQVQLAELRDRWNSARADAQEAQEKANAAIKEAIDDYNAKVTDLNAIVEEANAFREEVASAIGDYIGEKSEKWQEGDRGSAFAEWQQAWDDEVAEIEEAEAHEIEGLDDVPEELLAEDTYPAEPSV